MMADSDDTIIAGAPEETAEVSRVIGEIKVVEKETERIEDSFEILTMEAEEMTKKEASDTEEIILSSCKVEEKDELDSVKDENTKEKTIEFDMEPQENNGITGTEAEQYKGADHVKADEEPIPADVIENKQGEESDNKAWDWDVWSNWGTSVINSAAHSVTNFTSQVGDGLIQVLETVESGLLAQDDVDDETSFKDGDNNASKAKEPITDQKISPEMGVVTKTEGGRETDKGEKDLKVTKEMEKDDSGGGASWWLSSLSSVVSKTTSVVQQTTNVVVHGGLDMLETIGKKTYDAITEGDHGLKKVLIKNKERQQLPNLSLVLKEAREIADLKLREEETLLESKKFLYSYWFDEYQGLVQLEAFELLANQNESRCRDLYDKLAKEKLSGVKKRLAQLNEVYKTMEEDIDDDTGTDQDFHQVLLEYAAKLPVSISVQKLLECQEHSKAWLEKHKNFCPGSGKDESEMTAKDVLKRSMQFLAQTTALSIQHFHKLAQLITRSPSPSSSSSPVAGISTIETTQNIMDFAKAISKELSLQSGEFVLIMGRFESSEAASSEDAKQSSEHITTIYLEASNSNNFLQRSLKLLMPALQIATMTAD